MARLLHRSHCHQINTNDPASKIVRNMDLYDGIAECSYGHHAKGPDRDKQQGRIVFK